MMQLGFVFATFVVIAQANPNVIDDGKYVLTKFASGVNDVHGAVSTILGLDDPGAQSYLSEHHDQLTSVAAQITSDLEARISSLESEKAKATDGPAIGSIAREIVEARKSIRTAEHLAEETVLASYTDTDIGARPTAVVAAGIVAAGGVILAVL